MPNLPPGFPLPDHRYSWRRRAWPAYVQLMKRTDWPIFVGPWYGEVGFECLYWIPFLHELMGRGISPERVIPISRGGAAVWYGTPRGLELYAMRSVQDVRIHVREQRAKTGLLKQIAVTDFDRAILADAAETMGVRRYHVVHPAWMYHTLAQYWTGHKGVTWLAPRTRYTLIPPPPLPDGLTLPEAFVAVKFYGRDVTFPANHKHVRPMVRATIDTIAQSLPVVLLDQGLHVDDHSEITSLGPFGDAVRRLSDLSPVVAERSLAVQSAVLARAQGFVGTFGGFAQLALRLGRPSISFYTDWGSTAIPHLHLSHLLGLQMGLPFQVFRVAELAMTRQVLPQVELTMTPDKDAVLATA